MEKPEPSHELTTTLHLGVRSVVDSSPSTLVEILLEESAPEERKVIEGMLNGDGERAMVVIHRGHLRGARYLIPAEGAAIGRSSQSDIFLDDATVSRTHAVIKKEGAFFTFQDLGSLNGSYINNRQVSSHQLTTGDEIQIGKYHMLFIGASRKSGEK